MFNSLIVPLAILAPAQAPAPRFDLHAAGGKVLSGRLESIDASGAVTLRDEAAVPAGDVIALRRADRTTPPWPDGAHVVLNNGDRIAGRARDLVGPLLYVEPALIRRAADERAPALLRLPLTAVSYVWLSLPASLDADKFPQVFAAERPTDQLVLKNGDLIAGTVSGFDVKKNEWHVESGGARRTVSLNKVIVIAFSTRLARARKPAGPFGHLVLTDGTRLAVLSPQAEKGVLTGRTMFKDSLAVPLADVAALDTYQGAATYLSDIKPSKFEYRTYQGEKYSWAPDRNLTGTELRVRGKAGVAVFDKGVAVHGPCRLSYALDGKYGRFECLVGLDAALGRRGSVGLRLLVDGKEHPINDGKLVTAEAGPMPVKIDVAGAKELTLVVDAGDGGNVGDHVNWCDARLIP